MGVDMMLEATGPAVDYPQLVQAYLRGDHRAGECLAEGIRNLLFRRLRRQAANAHTAEELAQDCMLHVFARMAEFDPDKGQFEAWITGFAHNALRSEWRRLSRSRSTAVSVDEIDEPSYDITHLESERDLLSAALHSLEHLDQELLHMRYSLGMSSDEIARASDMNPPQVRKRISRAVEKLRRHPAMGELLR